MLLEDKNGAISGMGERAVGEQHSAMRTVVLHLLPGALITAFYVVAAPVVRSLGFPSLMAIFLAIAFVLIPFELGYLIYQARKNGSTLGSVVLYRQPVPKGQFVALVLGLLAWSGICVMLLFPPLDGFLWRTCSPGCQVVFLRRGLHPVLHGDPPHHVDLRVGRERDRWSGGRGDVLRGYLLPRISRLGAWAPLVNTVLFSLYHFFTPWLNVSRIIGLLPMVYAAWWKRSIYVSMAVHVLGNAIPMLFLLAALPGAGSS